LEKFPWIARQYAPHRHIPVPTEPSESDHSPLEAPASDFLPEVVVNSLGLEVEMNIAPPEDENELVTNEAKIADQTSSSSAYGLLVASIERSTLAMKELTRQHSEMKTEAAENIASLQDQLSEEKQLSDELALEIESLKRDNTRLVEELAQKKEDFESIVHSMNAMKVSFEETTAHLVEKTEWLDHIGSRITSELNSAATEAERLLKDSGLER
jgi:hypothetical protein